MCRTGSTPARSSIASSPATSFKAAATPPDLNEKAAAVPRPERGDQRPEQPARHRRDGADARAAQRHSQFYINLADNHSLDHRGYSPDEFGYAVFGRVIAGMDVVEKIALVKTTVKDGMENLPVDARS